MTVKYSQALLNSIMGGRGVREDLEDFVLDVYDGNPPTNPEDARIGTKLARYTLSGGAVATTDRSTARSYLLTIAAGGTTGKTVKVTVTVEGVATTYTYIIPAADTGNETLINLHVARMLNDIPQLQAICDPTTPAIWVQNRIAGLALTLDNSGGAGDQAVTYTAKTSVARVNTLQFGPPVAGVISKPAGDTWECLSNLASGVAGYFTLCTPDDVGALDSTYVFKRVQGTLAAVGGDATIDPASITAAAVSVVLSFSLTLPTSKT
jgi:hypothetical protein